jgi:hypothetical protein
MKSVGFLGLLQKEKLLGGSICGSVALSQWSGKVGVSWEMSHKAGSRPSMN